MNPITVLIADDIPATREDIKRLLYFEEDIKVIGEAEDGNEAIQLTENLNPDVILMDINMPNLDGIKASEQISLKNPDAAVVIVSIQGEKEYLRKAMAAGARDYLVKPFSSGELASTIRQVSELNKRRLHLVDKSYSPSAIPKSTVQGKIITLFSSKGGVGKTTAACNLAISMAQTSNKKVVLVDMDLQGGDIAVMMNITARDGIAEIVQETDYSDSSLLESYLSPHLSGVRILLAPNSPELSEKVLPEHVEEILRSLKIMYDYVIVDTSAAINEVTLACLEASDHILVTLTQELPALRHARTNMEILEKLNLKNKARLLLNRERTDALKTKEVENNLGSTISACIPEDGKSVGLSVNKGQPFVLTNPGSHIADAIKSLAVTLSNQTTYGQTKEQQEQPKKSIIGKLFSF